MKTEMRRELARQPFEEKIRKIGQLIQLSAKLKAQRMEVAKLAPAGGTRTAEVSRRGRKSSRGSRES